MAGGRPTTYNDEIAARICELVATHECGLKKLVAMYDDLPAVSTINLWRFKHEEFSAQYHDAKRCQIDLIIENSDEMMDEGLHYYVDSEGNNRIDSPSVTLAIAKANNRKWFASKIAPKVYGATPDETKKTAASILEQILSGELKINK